MTMYMLPGDADPGCLHWVASVVAALVWVLAYQKQVHP
jgi:hypothetical protein